MKFVTILCVLSCVCATTVTALKCYSCAGSKECEDPFVPGSARMSDCLSGLVCTKAKVCVQGQTLTTRGCGPAVFSNKCKSADTGGCRTYACYCDSNLCNSASLSKPHSVIIVLAILMYIGARVI